MKEQGKLIPEQGKKTKEQGNGQGEQGSLISPRKRDFSIDKIDRRKVHLQKSQSLMKSAANGGLEPIAEAPKSCCGLLAALLFLRSGGNSDRSVKGVAVVRVNTQVRLR